MHGCEELLLSLGSHACVSKGNDSVVPESNSLTTGVWKNILEHEILYSNGIVYSYIELIIQEETCAP